MNNKIIFKAYDKYSFDNHIKPYPASQSIPEWWKNMSPYIPSEGDHEGKKIKIINGITNVSFKKCIPMLDAITSGYIIALWKDIIIKDEDNKKIIYWDKENEQDTIYQDKIINTDVFQNHSEDSNMVEAPDGYGGHTFKYVNAWIPKTPKGYSCLITSPFGYRRLPILAIPAIVDTDKHVQDLAVPCWVKNNFTGTIKRGTPLVQITPFKRSDWVAEYDYYKNDDLSIQSESNFFSIIVGHYLKNVWSKKRYR